MSKNIFELSGRDAEKFFLRSESFFEGELPKYFNFTKMLWVIRKSYIKNKPNIVSKFVRNTNNVNYNIYTSKDGKYSWRKLQILNPVLYIDLVHCITDNTNWEKIKRRINIFKFKCEGKIFCTSIPVVESRKKNLKASQIQEWWEKYEQGSLRLATEYSCSFTTDIADCYPSIYTHTVSWAIEGKAIAKNHINDKILGNEIDRKIQNMQYGQTNGIPQGSVLMTLIAEILLLYIDRKLVFELNKINSLNYKIIRYRDDYRIFVNSEMDGQIIVKKLAEVLLEHNLKLNSIKTKFTDDIILSSIKSDKYKAIQIENLFLTKNIQKNLVRIHNFLNEFQGSRQVKKYLIKNNDTILKHINKYRNNYDKCSVLIAICLQIAYKNPQLFYETYLIISTLLEIIEEKQAIDMINKIFIKFSAIPHSSMMNIFLQRIALPYGLKEDFGENICKIVINRNSKSEMYLWNFDWLANSSAPNAFINTIYKQKFIMNSVITNLSKRIKKREVDIFLNTKY